MAQEQVLLRHISRIWLSGSFQKELLKREREQTLISSLDKCVGQLFRNPQHSGINIETIDSASSHPVLSARINKAFRLILAQVARDEIVLLHFDNHDEAYNWATHNRQRIKTMLDRTCELMSGQSLRHYKGLLAFVREDEDLPIAIQGHEQFQRILQSGPAHYLAYLDGDQKQLVDFHASGALLVKGGAGTGKTAVAVHRTIKYATTQPYLIGPNRVLYLCYNRVLRDAVQEIVRYLCAGRSASSIEVSTFHSWCYGFLERYGVALPEVDDRHCELAVERAYWMTPPEQREPLVGVDPRYVNEEIEQVIKHNGLSTFEEYESFSRTGRGMRLKRAAKEAVWSTYERAEEFEGEKNICRNSDLPLLALEYAERMHDNDRYSAIVVDECQDFSPAMVRLISQLLRDDSSSLTVFADPAQTIYSNGFQWTQHELRKMCRTTRWLKTTYRVTREIHDLAQQLLDTRPDLVKELQEDAEKLLPPTRHGDKPQLIVAANWNELRDELHQCISDSLHSVPPHHVGVLAERWDTLEDFRSFLHAKGIEAMLVRPGSEPLEEGKVKLVTCYSAKGLDFPHSYIIGPYRNPHKPELESAEADSLRTIRLLYVAMTRASERLTLGVIKDRYHRIIESLDPTLYDASGTCASSFVNLRGFDLSTNFTTPHGV